MTTDERIENLEKGLVSARRLNRWLLAAVGVALGVWILVGTFGPATAGAPAGGGAVKEIRANRFVLEDKNGNQRAILDVDADGPGLSLFDAAGKTRAGLSVTAGGPSLGLLDAAGKMRTFLSVTADGPSLDLYDAAGKTRAGLVMDADGPSLRLFDAAGKGRIGMDVGADGPGLVLRDAAGKARATVGVTQTTSPDGRTTTYPESSLLLFGPDGKVIWQAR